MGRYINIKNFQHDGVGYSTLESISLKQSTSLLTDAGDNDAHDSASFRGPTKTSISVAMKDPVQCKALAGSVKGTTTFIGVPEDGGTELTVTVEGATYGGHDHMAKHGSIHTTSVNGVAAKSDGSDPVSYS